MSKDGSLNIRLDSAERRFLEEAAAFEGRTVTGYVRFHALRAAGIPPQPQPKRLDRQPKSARRRRERTP